MDKEGIERRIASDYEAFKESVRKEFKPEKFILFGSRARGEEAVYSDFDFIIVSSRFEGVPWLERISQVVKHWKSHADIDVLPYTPDEFRQKSAETCIVKEALRRGVTV